MEEGKKNLKSMGRSKAQMSVGKILGTISSAEKTPLFNIDLNLAPPEDEIDAHLSKEIVADLDLEVVEEKDRKFRLWNSLLQVAENALHEFKRKTTHQPKAAAEWDEAAPLVVRSTRGRTVAMPNKYRDSVLDSAAELPRYNKSGKSATKRKFR